MWSGPYAASGGSWVAAEIVDLDEYKLAKAATRGRAAARSRLKIELTAQLTVMDLPDKALAFLIRPEPVVADYLQRLVARIMDLGSAFNSLNRSDRIRVIDSHLLLADQFRFEALRRLGWVVSYPGQEIPMVRLVIDPASILLAGAPVELSPDHPDYPEFKLRKDTDGQVVIRRLIPEASMLFIARHGGGGSDNHSPA